MEQYSPKSRKQRWMRLVVGVVVIGIALIIFQFTPITSWLIPEKLQALKEEAGVFAPLAFIVLYWVGTILCVPGVLLTLSAGALFGPFLGTVWTVIGATLGATSAFLIARFIAGDWARAQFEKGDSLGQLIQGIEQDSFWFALSIRLAPIFPFVAVNYLLGLTPIGLLSYILATAVGIIPGTFAYAWLGRSGLEAARGGPPWQLVGALTVLALVSTLPILLKRLKPHRG